MTAASQLWKEAVAGLDAPTPLWLDRAPGRVPTQNGARRRAERQGPLWSELEAAAARLGVRSKALVCGSWAVLLARYSREGDVVYGVVEAEDTKEPRLTRTRLEWTSEVTPWLAWLEASTRQFEESEPPTLEQLGAWSSLPPGTPLFESVLVIGPPPRDGSASWIGAWPLVVGVEPGARDSQLWVDADATRFDEWTVHRLTEHLARALEGLATSDGRRLGDLSLLSAGERRCLLEDWNATANAERAEATIHELFAEGAAAWPDRVALIAKEGTLTYGELEARANRVAHHLRGLGVGQDTPVGLCIDRSLDLVVALLGALKAGGAYLAVDPAHPIDRLAFLLKDANAPVLITQRQHCARFPSVSAQCVLAEELEDLAASQPATAPESGATAESLAYIAYTSGSTGTPKGAMIRHRAVNRLVRCVDYVHLGPEETILVAAPLAFDASTFELWGALLNGGRCALYPDPVPTARGLARTIEQNGVTTLWLTAALFNAIVDEDATCLQGARQVLTGGEALSPAHIRRALEALPQTELFNGYGPTECTTFTAVYRIPREIPEDTRSIPIGRPIRDTQVYVVDDEMRPVPIGVTGELYVGGHGLARGYLARPELNAERFVPDVFTGSGRLYRTGDLVRWLPEGVLDYVGRIDTQVKIRGFRIEIGEIEVALAAHPSVQRVVVVAREDVPGTKRLVAYLVAHEGHEELGGRALRDYLEATLPDFMVPSAYVWLETLPINANGKVDTRRLPAPAGERPELGVPFVAPETFRERELVAVFEAALGVSGIGLRDNFFDLGGNSLLSLRVLAQVRNLTGRDVPIVRFFQQPTVGALVAFVEGDADALKARPRAMKRARAPSLSDLDDVAIIGIGGRFPGARNVRELWDNLCGGVESITFFGPDELDPSLPADLVESPSYVPARGILDGVDQFDAAFFGISPREAEVTDPQHRLFLEVSWEVLEEAGYVPEHYPGTIGVFGGVYNPTYYQKHVVTRPDLIERVGEFQVMVGNEKDYVTTRVAHKLNLTGPAVSIHTACSTSLVAVVEAFDSLRIHQCDMALAGGSSVTCPPRSGYVYQEGAMLSPDGHTRSFDAGAQGTVFSDGVAIVLLKRLSDARRDGDTIYGVLRGGAINNDGADKASFTAPSVEGQAAVIAAAHEVAGVHPRTISYVETHGTATPLGDPIELEALSVAFGQVTDDRGFCGIGSLKSNMGHLVIAAGGAGLIKTALALTHRKIPPSLLYEAPNPTFDLAASPFYVVDELRDWPESPTPRRAGVSAFGVGGTNAHVVVEEAPPAASSGPSRSRQLVVLSARTHQALEAATQRLHDHLVERPEQPLADVAFTLLVGRKAFAHRRAMVAAGRDEAMALLEGKEPRRVTTRKLEVKAPKVAFMFPGQGAQYVRMGEALYRDEPTFRAVVDYCAEILEPILGRDLRTLIYPPGDDDELAAAALRQTELTQPVLFVTEWALAQLWKSWGVEPQATIGHSVGEFVGAALGGVMALDDALRLVALRGRLMAGQPSGAMLSVRLSAAAVAPQLEGTMAIASDNGPSLCVVAGPHDAIARLEASLTASGVVCKALRTSHAFHSPMMDDVVDPFADEVERIRLEASRIPFVSSVTGRWITDAEATDPMYWARHVRATVRFREGIATLLAEPQMALLEVGPRATLATLARQQARDRVEPILSSLGHGEVGDGEWASLLDAAGQLWVAGVPLDGQGLYVHEERRRVPLPTYPFERKRFWVDPAPPDAKPVDATAPQPAQASPPPRATAFGGVPAPAFAPPVAPAFAAPTPPMFSPSAPMFGATAAPAVAAPVAASLSTTPATPPVSDNATSGVDAMSTDPTGARSALLDDIAELFEEVSGIEMTADDEEMTFFELGLDSLSLTQVAQQLQKTFKVKVTFRALMESFPTLATLAEYLEETVPKDLLPNAPAATPGAAADQPSAPQAPGSPPASPGAAFAPGAPGVQYQAPAGGPPMPMPQAMGPPMQAGMPPMMMGGGFTPSPWMDPQALWMMQQQFFQWHQQQMAYYAAAMQGAQPPVQPAPMAAPPGTPAPSPAPTPAETPVAAESSAAPASGATGPSVEDEPPADTRRYDVKKAFGAIARIHTEAEELTPKQTARLDAFVRRYNSRTRRSKEFTQRYRRVNADPRVVTGFRPAVKELVYPIVCTRSKGPYIWDLDDNQYVDVLNGFGCNYFGWQPDFVNEAVKAQIDLGIEIGPQTPLVAEVAELFAELTGTDRVAFCNTGSEAVMGTMRIARTVTGRSKIALFTGSYHGIFDEVIVRATRKLKSYPAAPGILKNTAENVIVLDYGTPESLEIIRSQADDLAAVLVEPVQSRRPDWQPREFLHEVRKITAEAGTVLIFDEVITGFRTGPKGAQGFFGVEADIGSYGKVVGGGYPIGVIAGKAELMDALDGGYWQFGDDSIPTVGVTYFAGTFVRHPLALAAMRAVLQRLKDEGPALQKRMNARTAELATTLNKELEALGAPMTVKHFSTLWKPFWTEERPYADLFFYMLRDRGIHIYDGFPCFLTTAHSDADIEAIVTAFRESVREMQEAGFLPEPKRVKPAFDASQPPVPGARLGRDANGEPAWFVPNPDKAGKYLKVG